MDIKCPMAGLKPNAIVINATIRSMKYNGGVKKETRSSEGMKVMIFSSVGENNNTNKGR